MFFVIFARLVTYLLSFIIGAGDMTGLYRSIPCIGFFYVYFLTSPLVMTLVYILLSGLGR